MGLSDLLRTMINNSHTRIAVLGLGASLMFGGCTINVNVPADSGSPNPKNDAALVDKGTDVKHDLNIIQPHSDLYSQPDFAIILSDISLDSLVDQKQPDIAVPDQLIPDLPMPDMSVPDQPMPDAPLPDKYQPDIAIPDLLQPDLSIPDMAVPDAPVPDKTIPDLPIPDFPQPDQPLPDILVPDQKIPDFPKPDLYKPDMVSGTGWVYIKAGTFMMGSPIGEKCRYNNETLHKVTLTHDFEMMSTEVTQKLFKSLMGYDPSKFSACGTNCPVEMVSWHESAAACNALSKLAGKKGCYSCTGSNKTTKCQEATNYKGSKIHTCSGYRLPTEAEWEYAYRAGTTTAFHNGKVLVSGCGGCNKDINADKIGWYCNNSGSKTHPVAQKNPNNWGLYDMGGNVREVVHDDYISNLGSAAQTGPVNSSGSKDTVIRGGGWDNGPVVLRAAFRTPNKKNSRYSLIGFRCVRTLKP
tara:strand:+ start:154 stop:1557 length:1404 start_codon:yes stop_codon:yes gene_type:complete